MTPSQLSFDHLTFGYHPDRPPLIKHFSYKLKEGSLSAILGPNGAGKTTLLSLALGWLQPFEGLVALDGLPLHKVGRRMVGQCMAFVPQNEHIPFEYSVLEYVLLGRTPYMSPLSLPGSQDVHIAQEALEKVDILGLQFESMLSLSTGERQLVLIARALAQQPSILLMDEPTAHLDLGNKVHLIHILQKMQQLGVTLLLTTHEPDLALAVSNEVILMGKGGTIASGATHQMITSESLTSLYKVPVKIQIVEGKKQVSWI